MHILNTFFDKIYIINLDRRPERWLLAKQELSRWSIEACRMSAVDGNTLKDDGYRLALGAVGLIKTNINILNDAKEKGYSRILILEDDVVFSPEINKIDQYLDAVPADYDMLYFSGNHNGHVVGVMPPEAINDKVVRVHETYSTHCVAIQAGMYDAIIDAIKPCQKPLDVYYAELQKKHRVFCLKGATPVATQRVGFSDILSEQADYQWLIK
jgi:hypothetical protein